MSPRGAHRPRLGAIESGRRGWDILPWLRLACGAAAVALAGEIAYIGLASPLLAVREVVIRGDPAVVEQVAARVHLPANANMLRAPLALLERQAEETPAVSEAHARRGFPRRLVVTVERREPVAVIRRPAQALLVDPEGVVFTVRGELGWGLPELIAPSLMAGDASGPQAKADVARLLGALRALGPDPRLQVARLELEADDGVAATLESGARVRLGPTEGLAARAKLLAAVLDELGAANVAYIDLGDPRAAYWRPRVLARDVAAK